MIKKIKVDIVSDNVWPWCFIGKRSLEKAIQNAKSQNPNIDIQV